MPTIRYEIRSGYALADPDLHRPADEDDPEALLEGVAMAGLVGVLRQLGDLAEFAGEIFHDLHEEVTATAARGHGLMLRVQQLELEFPSIERAFLSQTSPSPFAYNEGIDWRANIRMDQNLVTRGDMPRFILDSYEECRGPPRLFMLDKFDVAGAGACLKRYSDPSFFKVDLASSGKMEEEVREKKARKIKKKGSRWRNRETTKSFLAPLIRSNLEQVISEQISAKVPMRHIKLKSRNLMDSDISNKRSYMENLLEVHSPKKKVIDQVGSVTELHETVTSTAVNSPILKKRDGIWSPAKTEAEILPIRELADQKIKDIAVFTPSVPDEKVMIESNVKKPVTVHGYNLNEVEKYSPAILEVDQQKEFVDTQITIADGFDGHGSAEKVRTEGILNGYSSDGVEMDPSCLLRVDQKNSFPYSVFSSEGGFDGYRFDDVGSELENCMDALNTMESEIETDSNNRQKSDPSILNMEAQGIDGINNRQQELPAQFSEPGDLGNLTDEELINMFISSPSTSENSGSLSDRHPPQEDSFNFILPVIPQICLDEHIRTDDELPTISTLQESTTPPYLLTNTCNANGSEAMSAQAATGGAYSSSCIPESASCGDRVFPPANDEAQPVTIHPTETFSGYVEGNHQAEQQLNGNMEELSTYAGNSKISPDELLHLSDTGCSFLGEDDDPEDTHFIKNVDEDPSVLHPPNETYLDGVGNTHEGCQQLNRKEEVSNFGDNCDTNKLLPSPETGGSFSNSIGCIEEIHTGESPNEMSDIISMLDNLSLTQDSSTLNKAPVQFDETILLPVEKILVEQETEASSGQNMSLTIGFLSVNNVSIVKSGDLAADMDCIEAPETLAADRSSNNATLSHGVGENLDGNLPCTVHTSELLYRGHDGMESLKPSAYSTIVSDDLLSESAVPERADTAEESEDLFSQYTGGTHGDCFLKDVPTWSVNDPVTSSTEEDTETCSGKKLLASNVDLSIETSPIVPHPDELAAKVDNSAASSEDLINDNIGGTKILMPNFLPLELELFSTAEQPKKSHEMDSSELSPGASVNNEFPDGRNLQSAEPICMVIGGINLVADIEGFPCGPTTSNLHEEEHIQKNMECDESSDEYVIVEVDGNNQGACSIYSPKASAFDIELQEDYIPGSAYLYSHNLETDEMSYPKSTTVMPQIDNQTMSSTELCSEFPIAGSSYYSDAKLSHGVCQTMSSKPDVGKGSSIFLSEREDSFSRGLYVSTHSLVKPALPLIDDNKGHVTSSNQEDKHLETFDIQFDRAFNDEQTISQSYSKDIDNQSLNLEQYAILTMVEMNESGIPSSSDTRYGLQEVAVSSESTYEMSASSMTSSITQIIASSSSGISEIGPPECLEPQVVDATSTLQLQDVEGTPMLPPKPPVPEFLESKVVEAASSLQLQYVEETPTLPPFPPVPEFLEPKVVEAASSLQVQEVEGTPPLPPLPPAEWRIANLRFGSLISVGDTAQPPKATNPFMALSPLDVKHPQGSVTAGIDIVQPTTLPLWEDERVLQGSLNPEGETQHDELPTISVKEGLQQVMNPPNLFLPVSHSENETNSGSHDALMVVVEDKIPQHPELLQGGQSIEGKRPRLDQLVPSLELERSKHESISMGDPVLPLNPFLQVSSSEEFKHQYGYGVYGGESLQHLNLPVPLLVTGPNMPPYGFLYPVGENPSMIYDLVVPSTEGERPSGKPRSIRDRPRNPLIEAVAAHDKSTLRKVSEVDPPQARPRVDERDSLLEEIRNKSFNLKPANAPKVNIKGPPTNLKLAAILEKANAIRQAFVGSDEDDDGESWE